MSGQRPIKTFALDPGGLRDFGNTLGLGEVAQGNQQDAWFVFIFQRGFEVLGGKFRVLPKPEDDGPVMRDACSALHGPPH